MSISYRTTHQNW